MQAQQGKHQSPSLSDITQSQTLIYYFKINEDWSPPELLNCLF